jgi:hypothetical protein
MDPKDVKDKGNGSRAGLIDIERKEPKKYSRIVIIYYHTKERKIHQTTELVAGISWTSNRCIWPIF